jgi:hypothetical protein
MKEASHACYHARGLAAPYVFRSKRLKRADSSADPGGKCARTYLLAEGDSRTIPMANKRFEL